MTFSQLTSRATNLFESTHLTELVLKYSTALSRPQASIQLSIRHTMLLRDIAVVEGDKQEAASQGQWLEWQVRHAEELLDQLERWSIEHPMSGAVGVDLNFASR